MSGFNVILSGSSSYWGPPAATGMIWLTGAYSTSNYVISRSWDKHTVSQKIKEAQDYIAFLKDSRDRLKEIIG